MGKSMNIIEDNGKGLKIDEKWTGKDITEQQEEQDDDKNKKEEEDDE